MDNKEQKKDILNLELDEDKTCNDYKFLVQKLISMKNIINLLENKFLKNEI